MAKLVEFKQLPPRLTARWKVALDGHIVALEWSPDGKSVAAASVEGMIQIIANESGAIRQTLVGHKRGTNRVGWNDNRRLTSIGLDGAIRVWDTLTGEQESERDAGAKWADQLEWNAERSHLVSGAGKLVRLWDAAGNALHTLPEQASSILGLAWRPNAAEFAVATSRGVQIWDMAATVKATKEWAGAPTGMAWSHSGQCLAIGDQDATVHFWIIRGDHHLRMMGYPVKVKHLSWDAKDQLLATNAGSQVAVWDCTPPGPEGRTPIMLPTAGDASLVTALGFQRFGTLLAVGTDEELLQLWDVRKPKQPVAKAKAPGVVSSVAWSPGDTRLAVGTESGEVCLFATQ
ncbi:WD40 repeat domain-containing protein [Tuwongella immobilis]|uniref:Anaphase-promoting complex subunit 4-like WD40 domain-containing protein n=1 Tax=Tuwongella immobilis TaxID=692036 RepID=A0A6C2YLZ4_9BACT|nr:WD40 repeat domain-containing protein [Tuwongella immobilis]VIP02249.1 wd-40 repeat protein : WD40 repeat, subgroup OS=Ktedonobacter racemifer DSM 44963 GN=Krac_4098 PE=4 SV=1: WD40: WD40 [Tuwongella immobilis]VTS00834.1 wd-40 repeat protein : WD40 repeat, subgroup OS=Ktedonobacter racemifer DSM 44963 GN=Krac_4098 PE=4 SV=1: WD40: WD40 [Tuwongella immobilis]